VRCIEMQGVAGRCSDIDDVIREMQ